MENLFPDKKIATPCCVAGSANGLICVAAMFKRYCYIWNPCTNSRKRISLPSFGRDIHGFGYDSHPDDYKIIGSDSQNNIRIFSFEKKFMEDRRNKQWNKCV